MRRKAEVLEAALKLTRTRPSKADLGKAGSALSSKSRLKLNEARRSRNGVAQPLHMRTVPAPLDLAMLAGMTDSIDLATPPKSYSPRVAG